MTLKWIALRLAAWLVLALPMSGLAQFAFITNADGTTITITGYTGSGGNVTVPGSINGYQVTAIGNGAFYHKTNLTGVTIFSGIINIGTQAFAYCPRLTNIDIDAANPNYASVGGVFFNKTLTTLIQYPIGLPGSYAIPDSVTNIAITAFQFCSGLTNVTIGSSVATIGGSAFSVCTGLTSVAIPNSVISMGDYAFDGCSGLTNVWIGAGVSNISDYSFSQCSALANVAIPNNVINIGTGAFTGCILLKSVTIGSGVASIGVSAFKSCWALTNVTIPDSVHSLGNWAFGFCSGLTNATIGNGVTDVGNWTFAYCTSLHQVYFQGNAPTVNGADGSSDSTVFLNESGTAYYLPGATGWGGTFGGWLASIVGSPGAGFTYTITNGMVSIMGYTGPGGDVIIPGTINNDPVTTIGTFAFYGQIAVTSVTIPDSVTNIGASPFYLCSGLTNIAVDAANPSYASSGGVLFNKTLTTLIECPAGMAGSFAVPNSVTSIGDDAFTACSGLTNVTLGNGVASLGAFALSDCSGLTSVTIPGSVTNIGSRAFSYGYGLTNIAVDASNPRYASAAGVLFNKNLTTLIEYPAGLNGSYAIPNSVINIGDSAFANCTSLTSVTIPYGVASIGDYAFEACSGLTSVTIPASVASIGFSAFAYCTNLQQMYFPGNAPLVNGGAGSADGSVFFGGTGTVYFLPGAIGWGATFGGWPTAWWQLYQVQPRILGFGYGLGVRSNRFQFTVFWATNTAVVVEASTNLQNWTPVITNTLVNGSNAFTDSTWTNYPQQFYRVRSQ